MSGNEPRETRVVKSSIGSPCNHRKSPRDRIYPGATAIPGPVDRYPTTLWVTPTLLSLRPVSLFPGPPPVVPP